MKKFLFLLFLLLQIGVPRMEASTSSHQAAAAELLDVINARAIIDQIHASMVPQISESFSSLGKDLPPEEQEAVRSAQNETVQWMQELFSWETMRGMMVEIYTEAFTEEDIREITNFYKSPLGRKMLEKMPVVIRLSNEKAMSLVMAKMPELQLRIEKIRNRVKQK